MLLLRPPHFQSHSTHFVVLYDKEASELDGGGAALPYTCLRVPGNLWRRHWTQLLSAHRAELTDKMVLPGSTCHLTFNVLGKFEDPRFVHVYSGLDGQRGDKSPSAAAGCDANRSTVGEAAAVSSGDGNSGSSNSSGGGRSSGASLVLVLPRYGLEFEVIDGQVVSRNYTGYRLRQPHQQLVGDAQQQQQQQAGGEVSYTLPGFRQYLVLERMQGRDPGGGGGVAPLDDVMVLVPAGEVDVRASATGSSGGSSSGAGWGLGRVWIRLPVKSGARLQVSTLTPRRTRFTLRCRESNPWCWCASVRCCTVYLYGTRLPRACQPWLAHSRLACNMHITRRLRAWS